MDKEFFECDEYIKSEEIQYFPAERYRVNETGNSAAETFNAPETSVSENPSAKADSSGMSLGDAEEFVRSASASASASASVSLSASASASVGATGVLASIAAVCVATIVGVVPVPGITQNTVDEPPYRIEEPVEEEPAEDPPAEDPPAEEPPIEEPPIEEPPIEEPPIEEPPIEEPPIEEPPSEEPIDVGTLNFLNYRVDYYPDEASNDITSDITFYFEGELSDGLICQISDVQSDRLVELYDNVAVFENVARGDKSFDLIIRKNDVVVETRTITVEDHYLCDQSFDAYYAYKATYNFNDDDFGNTYNLYAYFDPAYEGEFVTYINIYDDSGDVVSGYETVIDGSVSGVTGINREWFSAELRSYYIKDNNYYSYCSLEEIVIGETTLSWQASISNDMLTLWFGDKIVEDIGVLVTHDDGSVESFSFNVEELVDNRYDITLSKISKNPTVEIFASAVLYDFDPSGYITEFIGSEAQQVHESANVAASLFSTVELAKFELFNDSYNQVYNINSNLGDVISLPVNLYFNGFLVDGDTYSVRVFNSAGTEVASKTDLTLENDCVTFVDLLADAEYTFRYYVKSGGEETLFGETTKALSMVEFPDLPNWYCLTPNPGDVLVTYNEDGSSDVYLYMNVQETNYDMYYKVYLTDVVDDGLTFFEYTGKENVAVLRNVPAGRYSIKVGVLINDNGTGYAVYDLQWPSGTIVTGLDESGYYPESGGDTSFDSSTGELYVSVSGKVVGDLHITIISDDGQPIEITVPVGDISAGYGSSTCTLDLSAYGLTSFTAVIEGDAIFQYGNGDNIKNEVTVAGDESCPFKIESVY